MRILWGLLAAGPQFYLAWMLLKVWGDPGSIENGAWVPLGVGIMGMEFVLVQSGVLFGVLAASSLSPLRTFFGFLGLGLLYSTIVFVMSMTAGGVRLLTIYAFVMLGRMSFFFGGISEAEKHRAIGMSALSCIVYMIMLFASIFLPWPQWGLGPEMVQKFYPDNGTGIWQSEPHRAIGAAAVYFCIMAILEILISLGNSSKNSKTGP